MALPTLTHLRRLKIAMLGALLLLLGACSVVQGSKLVAPESFGFVRVSHNIFIEAGADDETRARLLDAMIHAERVVEKAYGSVKSRPTVHACVSEACYENFGGRGSIAKVYSDRILLSPRGLNWHFLAHEWSHAEMRSRLTVKAWLQMPRWFDEGVAVAVSEAPEHSEDHWRYLSTSNIRRPDSDELHNLKSLSQWNRALGDYGEKLNTERRAKGEPEARPVYTAAGHELRPWLTSAGTQGLLVFIDRINKGEDFETAYRAFSMLE